MHDDPKPMRMTAYGLIMLCVVCLATLQRIPLVVMIPTLGFVFWRWWEQRHRRGEHWIFGLWGRLRMRKPGTSLVLSKQELVERKGDSWSQ